MLASIQKIISVEPIPDADRIEKVKVLGWDCVVRKGIFKPGDLCVYIEIDTIIPKNLLDETYVGEEKVRLRTVKMKKQISQGLVLDLNNNIFWPKEDGSFTYNLFGFGSLDNQRIGFYYRNTFNEVKEGDDLTETLGIQKYIKEIPASMQGIIKGEFPSFLHKTDEIKIQSEPELLKKLEGKPFYITTKLDGTSATYYRLDEKFGVCSRNLELKDGDNIYWNIARKYNLEKFLPEGWCIQGEICGPGIQGNKLKLDEHHLFVFNVRKIRGWENQSILILLEDGLEFLEFVPIELSGDYFDFSLEHLLELAKGEYENGGEKEGIVVRDYEETISFKVLNNDFLLKNGE